MAECKLALMKASGHGLELACCQYHLAALLQVRGGSNTNTVPFLVKGFLHKRVTLDGGIVSKLVPGPMALKESLIHSESLT